MADMYMEYARLLTNEDVYLNYSAEADTAYFDVKTRSITLPMFEYLDRDCNAGLTAHECGHALFSKYTPEETEQYLTKYGDLFNVLEDGYIEKMIVAKYPGILNFFRKAYQMFFDRDFFGVDKTALNELNFIEKLNLNLKLNRIGINIPMDNNDETSFLHKAYILNSNKDVIDLCDEIYEYLKKRDYIFDECQIKISSGSMFARCVEKEDEIGKENKKENEDSDFSNTANNSKNGNDKKDNKGERGGSGKASGDSGKDDIIKSQTMRSFNEALKNAVEQNKKLNPERSKGEYPIIIEDGFIRQDMMEDISKYIQKLDIYFETTEDSVTETMANSVKKLARNAVVYFEKLKQAKAIKAERNKTTGKIDTRKLANYKTSNNIFIKRRIRDKQQNHGVVMLIDYSSSMWSNVRGVLMQTGIVAEFCKACNIPFSIITFGGIYRNEENERQWATEREHVNAPFLQTQFTMMKDVIKIADEKNYSLKGLLNFVPSFFDSWNFKKKFNKLFFKNFHLSMGQTPTDKGLLCAYEEMKEMKSMYGLDKINLILITDGDYNNYYPYCNLISNYIHNKTVPAGIDFEAVFNQGRISFDYSKIIFNNYVIDKKKVFDYEEDIADYGHYQGYLEYLFYAIKHDLNAKIVFSYLDSEQFSSMKKAYRDFRTRRNMTQEKYGYNSNYVSCYWFRLFDDYYQKHGCIPNISDKAHVFEMKDLSILDKVILTHCPNFNKLNVLSDEELCSDASSFSKLRSAIKKNSQNLDYLEYYVRYLIEEIA